MHSFAEDLDFCLGFPLIFRLFSRAGLSASEVSITTMATPFFCNDQYVTEYQKWEAQLPLKIQPNRQAHKRRRRAGARGGERWPPSALQRTGRLRPGWAAPAPSSRDTHHLSPSLSQLGTSFLRGQSESRQAAAG